MARAHRHFPSPTPDRRWQAATAENHRPSCAIGSLSYTLITATWLKNAGLINLERLSTPGTGLCHSRLRPGSRGPSEGACHLCRLLTGIHGLEAFEALDGFDDGQRCTAHGNRARSACQRWFLQLRCNENISQCNIHAGSSLFAAVRPEPANGDFGTGSIAVHLGPPRSNGQRCCFVLSEYHSSQLRRVADRSPLAGRARCTGVGFHRAHTVTPIMAPTYTVHTAY